MDEAHTIKDKKAKISTALAAVKTKRRIALTGSPLQNNLDEYFVMVNWVKPRHLGTPQQFKKSIVIPISIGEHKDANQAQIKEMKKKV